MINHQKINRRTILAAMFGAPLAVALPWVVGASPKKMTSNLKLTLMDRPAACARRFSKNLHMVRDSIYAPEWGVIWVSGPPASGKTTIAIALATELGHKDPRVTMNVCRHDDLMSLVHDYGMNKNLLSVGHEALRRNAFHYIFIDTPENFDAREGDIVSLAWNRIWYNPNGKVIVFSTNEPPVGLAVTHVRLA